MNWLKEDKHTTLMYFWMAMVPVTLLTPLKYSITFVVLMSLYANVEASAAAKEAKQQDSVTNERLLNQLTLLRAEVKLLGRLG